jgi:ATP-dependent Lhr-like helicase
VEATRDPLAALRGRMEALGPVEGGDPLLLALENEGTVLRSRLGGRPVWSNRRLLARIHRLMLDRQRKVWKPVAIADFLRFLTRWQGVHPEALRDGPRGVAEAVEQLAGFAMPAPAWTGHALPRRVRGFRPDWLEQLALGGEVAWGRLWSLPASSRASLSQVPICLLPRADLDTWLRLAPVVDDGLISGNARAVLAALDGRGALFQGELVRAAGLLPEYVEMAQAELIAHGLITCDSANALRWLLLPSARRARARLPGGRWSRLRRIGEAAAPDALADEESARFVAKRLLRRTGVVFRQTIERERQPVPWRDLLRALRLMELSGEVRGGRFVAGFSGEQYALPEAAERLRQPQADTGPIEVSAADPLNYHGILLPDARIPSTTAKLVRVV